jgi:hypothetical protein
MRSFILAAVAALTFASAAGAAPHCDRGQVCGDTCISRQAVCRHPPIPRGATALCRDGTYSFSRHHAGTCSDHGGVRHWL